MTSYQFITMDQPIGRFYVIKIKASELIEISESKERNPYNSTGIQRKKNQKRIKEIAQYCNTSSPMFPTPIILSGKSDYFNLEPSLTNKESKEIEKNKEIEEDVTLFNLSSGKMEINKEAIIRDKKFLSIVDGQHRLAGISLSERSDDFELLAMFIFDTESYEDANIFSIINRNQKQVSKSLVYDLYGLSDQMTVEKFSHEIVKELNTSSISLLKDKIKMLGYKIDTLDSVQFVSQGTLVDRILPAITKDHLEDNQRLQDGDLLESDERLFLRRYLLSDDLSLAKIHVISFFNSWIKMLRKKYPNNSILFKTVGFIAAFKVFENIYKMNFHKSFIGLDMESQYEIDISIDKIEEYQKIYLYNIEKLNFEALDISKISSSFSGANYIEKVLFSMSDIDMHKYVVNVLSNKQFQEKSSLSLNYSNNIANEKSIVDKYLSLLKQYEIAELDYKKAIDNNSYSDFSNEEVFKKLYTAFYDLRVYCINIFYNNESSRLK